MRNIASYEASWAYAEKIDQRSERLKGHITEAVAPISAHQRPTSASL